MVGLCGDNGGGGGAGGGALGDRRFGGRVRCCGCGHVCRYLWWVGQLVFCRNCMPDIIIWACESRSKRPQHVVRRGAGRRQPAVVA